MCNRATDPAPNFSKMVLRIFVKVQGENLNGKCAPLNSAIGNQQCPISPLTLPPTLPKWPMAFLLGIELGTWVGKSAPIAKATKNQQFPMMHLALPQTFPKLSFACLSGFRLEARVENVFLLARPCKINNVQSAS